MKKVLLTDYFYILSSKQEDKINLDIAEINDIDALPYVSRSSGNNGVTDYCLPVKDKINKGLVITLALDGSTGATFYQHHDFLSGQNIWILKAKEEKIPKMDHEVALYLITSIRKAVRSYTYNLSLTKTRLKNIKLMIPVLENEVLDIDYIKNQMRKIKHIELLDDILEERYQI